MLGLAQAQLQKWARSSTAVSPKMCRFREKLSQVSPVPKKCLSARVVTVYNKCTGGGGTGVSPAEHPAYCPALCMFGLLSVVLSASPVALS
jgi:hypothetical protein